MKANMIDDGYSSFLVGDSTFDGIFEIPHIYKPKEIKIPTALIPFSMRNQSKNHSEAIMFYEHDKKFSTVLTATTEYLDELEPEVVLVYGEMPKSIFGEVMNRTKFVHFDDWTKVKHHSKG